MVVPTAPAAAAEGVIASADGGTIATTLVPAANAFPTGSGAQRQISRDCGHSTEVPGNRSLWLFCDTAIYDDVTGSAPGYSGRVGFVPSGTAGLAPIVADPTPSNPVRLTEATYPSLPRPFIVSSSRRGTAGTPVTCASGPRTFAWTQSVATLPGTSTVLAFYQDQCPGAASGFAPYDIGVAELTLGDVPDGDVSGGARAQVSRQYDSVQVNATPGSVHETSYAQGAVVDGPYLYLYGVRPARYDCSSTCRIDRPGAVELARVTWVDSGYRDLARYRYFTGVGTDPWSASEADAVNILPDASTPAGDGMSVRWQPEIGRYVMIHADTSLGTSVGPDLRTAPTPWGPWSATVTVEPNASSARGYPAISCQRPVSCRSYKVHSELSGGTRLWFSYVREGDLANAMGQASTIENDPGMTVRLASVPFTSLPSATNTAIAPRAPTTVTATAGDGRATVSWQAPSPVSGATVVGYRVTPYRGTTKLAPVAFSGTVTSGVVLGLDNTVAHTFAVTAMSATSEGPASARSAAVTPRGAPRAPTAVTGEPGDASVSLSWTAPTNTGGAAVTGYRVTPYLDGVAQTVRVLSSTATSKVITSLRNGSAYTFTVQAVTSLGTSGESGTSGTVQPFGAPAAPTDVSATPGNGVVPLTWRAPTDNGGATITGYRVTPYVGGTAGTPKVLTTTTPSTTMTGLTNGTSYTFTVAAINGRGTGTASAPTAAVTPRTMAGAPTGLTVVAGNGQVTVSWTAPTDNGGRPITGYQVVPSADGVFLATRTFSSTQTTQTINGLANGTNHVFIVRAVTEVGAGTSSDFSPGVTPRTTPGAPTGLTVTPGNGQVTLSFTAPVDNGGATVSGYRITPYVGSTALAARDVSFVTTHIVSGLANGTAHTFVVQALNPAGAGPAASSGAATPRTLPGAPGAVTATAGDRSATVSWSAPASDGGAPVTGYTVTPWVDGTAGAARTYTSIATRQVVTGLTNGTGYRFVVRAVNAAGSGASTDFSNHVIPAAPTIAPVPASAPTGVAGTAGNGLATLTWTAPISDGGASITGYRLTTSVDGGAGTSRDVSFATLHIVTGLTNGRSYRFTVQAITSAGAGAASAASAAVVPRTTPGAPGAASARGGDRRATVSWSAPTDDGGGTVTGYMVTPWLGGSAQAAQTFSGTATTQVVTGLTNGATYRFSVRAVNSAGPGASSDFSNAVVPAGATTPPTAHAPYASWDEMVRSLYQAVLGRAPSASERTGWVSRLSGRQATSGDLIAELRSSPDQVEVVDAVARLYRAYFLRSPDAGGLDYWIAQRRAGRSLFWISESFARSAEFTIRYGALSNEAFMDLVYRQVLERAPEAAGHSYWVEELRSGRRTRGRVMVGFSEAAEYRAKNGTAIEAAIAHLQLLGRAPSTSELTQWVDRRRAGTTAATLYTEILDSSEHARRAQ